MTQGELVRKSIMELFLQNNVTGALAQNILDCIRKFNPHVPTTIRGLLKDSGMCVPRFLGQGVYYHIGLKENLQRYLDSWVDYGTFQHIGLQINYDGLSISNSSSQQLWPFLGRITTPYVSDVFLIGIHGGLRKPSNFNEVAMDLLAELKDLYKYGLYVEKWGRSVTVSVLAFICDTPARSNVKQTVGHNGKTGCDKCEVIGCLEGRMTFPNGNHTLRNDRTFRGQVQASHHRGRSCLEELPLDMVKSFPLEPMHLIYLGVVKKLVFLWQGLAARREKQMHSKIIADINNGLQVSRKHIPCDFQRKCRSLDDVSQWKATKCRLFLLYLGPVLLRNTLPCHLYANFRRLSLAVYLLSSTKYSRLFLDAARTDLSNFLLQYENCFGNEQIVYNIHSLKHIADDVELHGPLEEFSAFPFESYMRKIRQSVHCGYAVAKQAAQRYVEHVYLMKSTGVKHVPKEAGTKCVEFCKGKLMYLHTIFTSYSPDNVILA
uniref:Uncharacterized protein n=1 Tax=Trichobilharzia regenti TaxID=157069 RepID=A0AA85KFG3_TRIRE|nr:unnamed protein product [Trichobilharzia regenti]